MIDLRKYSKLIAAVLGVLSAVLADNVLDLNDIAATITALTAAGVFTYAAPANAPTDG